MKNAMFYHAGCPVCVSAEESITTVIDRDRYDVEIVHLREARDRIAEAESRGVISVPALVVEGRALHINFGASLDDVKA
ncbi:MAG: thioredoxin family protein [Phycisphaerales bacterium]|nr:thioredoxin family protein [Phycisphaerales bacterium]